MKIIYNILAMFAWTISTALICLLVLALVTILNLYSMEQMMSILKFRRVIDYFIVVRIVWGAARFLIFVVLKFTSSNTRYTIWRYVEYITIPLYFFFVIPCCSFATKYFIGTIFNRFRWLRVSVDPYNTDFWSIELIAIVAMILLIFRSFILLARNDFLQSMKNDE